MPLPDGWAKALTNARLADDLDHLADNIRWCSADERAVRLHEAARRLEPEPRQVLVTLRSGAQLFVHTIDPQPYFKERTRLADSWSLNLGESETPHAKGTYYVGEW